MFVKKPDLKQLQKAEMFAHELAQKLTALREQVEQGAPSPNMVWGELDSLETLVLYLQTAIKKTSANG